MDIRWLRAFDYMLREALFDVIYEMWSVDVQIDNLWCIDLGLPILVSLLTEQKTTHTFSVSSYSFFFIKTKANITFEIYKLYKYIIRQHVVFKFAFVKSKKIYSCTSFLTGTHCWLF